MNIYKLTSVNLSKVNGQQGQSYIKDNWVRYFDDIEKAKSIAEEDYRLDSNKTITWKELDGGLYSGDLLFVEYGIEKINIE